MQREPIRLDPDKVRLLITRSGIPLKQLLDGMSTKTVHRIKAEKNTSLATGHKPASDWSVTVEALMSPVKEEMDSFLPVQWLCDESPSSCGKKHVPFCGAIGGYGYLVDGSL